MQNNLLAVVRKYPWESLRILAFSPNLLQSSSKQILDHILPFKTQNALIDEKAKYSVGKQNDSQYLLWSE